MNISASGFAIRKNRHSSSFVAGKVIFACFFNELQRKFIPFPVLIKLCLSPYPSVKLNF